VPVTTPHAVEWSPDGTFLLVNEDNGDLGRYFLDGRAPQPLLQGVHIEPEAFQPPVGTRILYERDDDQRALWTMNVDGTDPVQLFGGRSAPCACAFIAPARWSPDGRHVAFALEAGERGDQRIFTVAADGTAFGQVASETGFWQETDPTWSPDGKSIAFNRRTASNVDDWTSGVDPWSTEALGLISSDGTGPVRSLGINAADAAAIVEWAPDGRSILSLPATVVESFTWSPSANGSVARPTLIDVDTGRSTQLDWSVASAASWQRK